MTKYFVGEIDLPNGKVRKDLIEAKDINNANDIIENRIKISHMEFDRFNLDREKSVFAPFLPTGSFITRLATTQEILEDQLNDFAGGWAEYAIQRFAEEIIETVLETVPKEALIEELKKRECDEEVA